MDEGERRSAAGSEAHGRPAEERQLRETRILDAVVALMVRWGYRKTTIDDVAREAGVGKGTIYLHWKDKNELFRAALMRASQQSIDAMLERLASDPNGGQFHRFFAHGMVAVFAHPLLSVLMSGKSDIFQGLMSTFEPSTINQLIGTSSEQISRLQQAGLIRSDLSVNRITFLIGALKTGIITASQYTPEERMPSTEAITDGLSDLIQRWLQPEGGTSDDEEGRRIVAEWMDQLMKIGSAYQSREE